jgi:hypothetical protein
MNQQKTLYSSHIFHQKQGKANKKDMQKRHAGRQEHQLYITP